MYSCVYTYTPYIYIYIYRMRILWTLRGLSLGPEDLEELGNEKRSMQAHGRYLDLEGAPISLLLKSMYATYRCGDPFGLKKQECFRNTPWDRTP